MMFHYDVMLTIMVNIINGQCSIINHHNGVSMMMFPFTIRFISRNHAPWYAMVPGQRPGLDLTTTPQWFERRSKSRTSGLIVE